MSESEKVDLRSTAILPCCCPECGHGLSRVTHKHGQPVRPGDVSICGECGTVLAYTAEMAVRRATQAEWDGLTPQQRLAYAAARVTIYGFRCRDAESERAAAVTAERMLEDMRTRR